MLAVGVYLALTILLIVQQSLFAYRFTRSTEVRRLFFALDIDPAFSRWAVILGLAEILAYVDSARWHLLPALRQPLLQTAGVILYAVIIAWLFYVDRFLFHHFPHAHEQNLLLTDGPFRLVRHPRYTGMLFTRVAMPLILASPIAWCLLPPWLLVIRRRIRLEELYLRKRFGPTFDRYLSHTPQLLPRLHP